MYSLCFGSEIWVIRKNDEIRVETTHRISCITCESNFNDTDYIMKK